MKKMGLDCDVLPLGCCGMAGSFGFEKDKYDVSIAIGERKLLPAVRKAPLSTLIIADGFSCREQIAQQTGRHALHLAEIIQIGVQQKGSNRYEVYPENALVNRRKSTRRKARLQALVVLASIGAGVLGWMLLRNADRRKK